MASIHETRAGSSAGVGHRPARSLPTPHRTSGAVSTATQAPSRLGSAVSVMRRLQQNAGNAAVLSLLALQRHYDMREHTGHTPSPPYTEIHFRFDTETLPARPHEFLHVTVQNNNRSLVKHYYYDSWAGTWRQQPPYGNPLGGDLAEIQGIAIGWAEQKAAQYGTQFRPPNVAAPQKAVTAADFVDLGTKSPQEIERAARAKAREDQRAEQQRLKKEAARLKQEEQKAKAALAKAQRAEAAARLLAQEQLAEAKRKARLADIADLAFAIQVAFDYSEAAATARATEMIDANARRGAPPMSEAALAMYG